MSSNHYVHCRPGCCLAVAPPLWFYYHLHSDHVNESRGSLRATLSQSSTTMYNQIVGKTIDSNFFLYRRGYYGRPPAYSCTLLLFFVHRCASSYANVRRSGPVIIGDFFAGRKPSELALSHARDRDPFARATSGRGYGRVHATQQVAVASSRGAAARRRHDADGRRGGVRDGLRGAVFTILSGFFFFLLLAVFPGTVKTNVSGFVSVADDGTVQILHSGNKTSTQRRHGTVRKTRDGGSRVIRSAGVKPRRADRAGGETDARRRPAVAVCWVMRLYYIMSCRVAKHCYNNIVGPCSRTRESARASHGPSNACWRTRARRKPETFRRRARLGVRRRAR